MTLPPSLCPTEEATLPSGATVKIRSLSRMEALLVRSLMPDVAQVEKLSIRFACDVTEPEVESWYAMARNDDVEALINHIARLSGLAEAEGKADAEG